MINKLFLLSSLILLNLSVKAQLLINNDSLAVELHKSGYENILFLSLHFGLGYSINHRDTPKDIDGVIYYQNDIESGETWSKKDIDINDSVTIIKKLYGDCNSPFRIYSIFQKAGRSYILKLDYCNNYNIIPLSEDSDYLYFLKYESIILNERLHYANPDFKNSSPTPLYTLKWYVKGQAKQKVIVYGSFFAVDTTASRKDNNYPIIRRDNALHTSIFIKRMETTIVNMENKKLFSIASRREYDKKNKNKS